ncbi:50S ribosomal protein L11 methyltransferase [Nitratireductor sp. GZWM139]|uniref:50S ribosomal protein L11 methyltransferase n=1 Tax=Nitratireductor sp. GZWM139 TaxID=2950541 RepID=UPI0024BF0A74|nr:50S ribosomal protein L11 methyltransferase [Nitratireductor sp. GZWM139]MDJ1462667.1 50S ribosomal protein L11 methyltransferase [Nitratireductor sp. GZWM139]
MGQTRLFLTAQREQAEAIFSILDTRFEEDGLPISIFEPEEDSGIFQISVYTEDDVDQLEKQVLECLAGISPTPALERETVPDIDWVSHSLEGLQPVRVGRFLVHGSHDRHLQRIGDIAIEIDAGLAFGTGHHGTTAGCLEAIAAVLKCEQPRNALDLGTGSAVLAIAVAKAARIPVLATDIDDIATQVARANVQLNGVTSLVDTQTAPGFHHAIFAQQKPFDLIVANILARPLMGLAPAMARHLTPGGSIILSGILERQRRAVIAAYSVQGFRHIRTQAREGWVTIHMKR